MILFTSGLTLQKFCFSPEASGKACCLLKEYSQEAGGGACYSASSLLTPEVSTPSLGQTSVASKSLAQIPLLDLLRLIVSKAAELSCRDYISLPRLLAASGNQVWDLVKARKVSVRLGGLPGLCCAWREPVNAKAPRRLGACEDWLCALLSGVGKVCQLPLLKLSPLDHHRLLRSLSTLYWKGSWELM